MFLEAKPDGRIHPLVDPRSRNDNTVADHSQIPNQQTILQAVARGKYRSKIDLSDAYFQTRVHLDQIKYNTIKTPFGGFTSQVMMQGDMNAPATFVRVMDISKKSHFCIQNITLCWEETVVALERIWCLPKASTRILLTYETLFQQKWTC